MISLYQKTDVAPLLAFRSVQRLYGEGDAQVRALAGVDFEIRRGEFIAITGASGSGKSTAVSILGCLELPTAGEYLIEGHPVQALSKNVLAARRNTKFGFIFQSYNLLSRTSALAGIAAALRRAFGIRAARVRRGRGGRRSVRCFSRTQGCAAEPARGTPLRVKYE